MFYLSQVSVYLFLVDNKQHLKLEVPIIITTHKTTFNLLTKALNKIENLDFVVAKIAVIKTIHKSVKKYIAVELMKCNLGEATIFNNGEYGPLACTGKYGATGPKAAIYVRDRIGDNGKIFNDKNPYDTANFAVKRGGSYTVGQITIGANPTTLTLYTCTKTGCAAADKLTATITIDW